MVYYCYQHVLQQEQWIPRAVLIASINGPTTGRYELKQMPIGVTKVDASATAFPLHFALNDDLVLFQPSFPRLKVWS